MSTLAGVFEEACHENIELRCAAHNQYQADLDFGRAFMDASRGNLADARTFPGECRGMAAAPAGEAVWLRSPRDCEAPTQTAKKWCEGLARRKSACWILLIVGNAATRRRPGNATAITAFVCAAVALTARAAAGAPDDFHAAVSDSGPLLYYQFNESTGAAINHGSLGALYDATYFGTPFRAVGTAAGDTGVRFDSADDYLESLSIAPLTLAGNPTFSAEALVFVLEDGGAALWAPLLHWGISSPGDPTMKSVYFSFSNGDAEEIFAGFYNGGLQTVDPVPKGRWHHVVWTRTGGGAANVGTTVYVDGVNAALETDPDLPADSATPLVVNSEFRIDRARDFTRFFTGNLDELALYDRILTADEVEEHYAKIGNCGLPQCLDFDGSCRSCAQPLSTGPAPLASDALAVLRRAVGSRKCNACVCDVDSSGSVVASDALLTLKRAVGQPIALDCPAAS